MVSPLSLYVFAAVLLILAGLVGRLRRIGARDALADGRAALVGTLSVLVAAVVLFAVSRSVAASELWGGAGAVALVASPIGGALALRARGRRSIPRALFAASVALAGVTLWLTLNLRGPGGGWTLIAVVVVLPAAAVALASAACLGWWTKRATVARATCVADGRDARGV